MVDVETNVSIDILSIGTSLHTDVISVTMSNIETYEPTFKTDGDIEVGFYISESITDNIVEPMLEKDVVLDYSYRSSKDKYYDGDYVITPKAKTEQILETKDKKMYDDVTVKKVPFYETSNEYGTTVYIADEV